MAIVVLALLFVVAAAVIVYPLLSRQASIAATAGVTDRDIERAVRRLRAARGGDLECPTCGRAYRVGDRFCVKCGADLPAGSPAATPSPAATICPQCGTALRPGDVFCSKCGHRVAAGEES
ncbi:MAG: zinc ribbon domain-containing protein [Anaerolineae bacterium]|nr:zinc ribbon domain-containing protein [Anaerolineae bacterium]